MISVFKKHAPAYKRMVRRYALDVWKKRNNDDKFLRDAERYKAKYERDLFKYYRDNDIKIYPNTVRVTANQWLVDQQNLMQSVKVIGEAKKDKLTAELFEKLKSDQTGDVQKMLNKIYLTAKDIEKGASVYQVFSFSENFEKKAEQIGEQSAFELGAEVNHAVISELGDGYDWNSQEDTRVRATHRKLNGKSFLYSDPPLTIDEYGHEHKGPPGTAWGCRCFETPQTKKALRRYVARA